MTAKSMVNYDFYDTLHMYFWVWNVTPTFHFHVICLCLGHLSLYIVIMPLLILHLPCEPLGVCWPTPFTFSCPSHELIHAHLHFPYMGYYWFGKHFVAPTYFDRANNLLLHFRFLFYLYIYKLTLFLS